MPGVLRAPGSDAAIKPGTLGAKVAAEEDRKRLDALAVEMKKKADAVAAQVKGKGVVIEIISDGKRQVIELPPGTRILSEPPALPRRPEVRWEVKPGQPGQPPAARFDSKNVEGGYAGIVRPADTEKRLADLEKRLEELMRSVKELRGELNKPVGPTPKEPPPANRKLPEVGNPFAPAPKER